MTFGVQNTIVVTEHTVTVSNQYHTVQYPIRCVQDIGPLDRIVGLDSWPYKEWNLYFLYNEGKQEHFFIDCASYDDWWFQNRK